MLNRKDWENEQKATKASVDQLRRSFEINKKVLEWIEQELLKYPKPKNAHSNSNKRNKA